MILVAVRKEEAIEGRKICEPTSMWLASTIAGFTARRSCQRRPLPKFSSASFQSESPGLTTTTFSFAGAAGAIAGVGGAGVMATIGGAERGAGGREAGEGAWRTTGATGLAGAA